MTNAEQRQAPGKRWPLPARIYLLGAVILAAGWIAGVLIYLSAARDEAGDLAYGPGWQRQYDFQLERIGGKAAVLAAEFSQWFSDLWHGRQLAVTVAILCTGIALLCFFVAREMSLAANRDD
ncbi:hypothetical protein [Cupriavidus basilensis]|uniref:Uncharacterized protein n=1 Tax=Cupriavidus basilensis TaxID=68895 RepID=A0A643FZV4_9BURK|nr:hypothetical protein [Cupriavidus basilensis]QOT80372.1 hypothetical protein F7R26_023255 [Cupriavidus basilensis]